MSKKIMPLLILSLMLILTLLTPMTKAWDYSGIFSDSITDVSNDYLNIDTGGYSYDSTQIYLNMTVIGNLRDLGFSNPGYIYNFYLDIDNDPTTGYQVPNTSPQVGGDYMISWTYTSLTNLGYLYKYSTSGWEQITTLTPYLSTDGKTIGFYVPKDQLSGLGSQLTLAYETRENAATQTDLLQPTDNPLPVPESWFIVVGVALASAVVAFFFLRKSGS